MPSIYRKLGLEQRDAVEVLRTRSNELIEQLLVLRPTTEVQPILWQAVDLEALVATAIATGMPRLVRAAKLVQHCCQNLVADQKKPGVSYPTVSRSLVDEAYANCRGTALREVYDLHFGALVILDLFAGAQ